MFKQYTPRLDRFTPPPSPGPLHFLFTMVKAVIFTDFDGTITLQDSNDFLTDNYGFGLDVRKEIFKGVISGTKSFRDGFTQMIDSIKPPYDDCLKLLRENIHLDPGFKDTLEWAQRNGIPVVVVSSGMYPFIKALLEGLVGSEAMARLDIVSNDMVVDKDGRIHVTYRDESPHGHDKSRTIARYKEQFESELPEGSERPVYFYCGDGVSDLSAAKECDLLFAREGKDLITFCKSENVPYHEFESFADILRCMKDVLAGKTTVAELMEN